MLPTSGTISLKDIYLETPSIKPINIKEYMNYYGLTGKTGMSSFYGKKERLLKEVLIFKDNTNLQFQLANRRPQTQEMIFNNWGRIKGNLFYENKAAAEAANDKEAKAWYFENNQIYMPLNVEPINGFVSNMEFENYELTCTLASNNADDDTIGLIAAFHRENNNNYYLCFYANMNGTKPKSGIGISYQGADATHDTWGNDLNLLFAGGTFTGSVQNGWVGKERTLKIKREGDTFKFWYSDINSTKLPLEPHFELNLNSDPKLLKFRGKKKYGYMTNSQPYSTYKNIEFVNQALDENLIIDSTNKKVYRFNINTNKWDLKSETVLAALGKRNIILNPEGHEYNENYWYETSETDLINKGKYLLNTQPDLTKVKNETQFINITDIKYSTVNTSLLSNTISAVQRRGYYKTPIKTDILLSTYNNSSITLNDANFNKLDITNLDRASIVLNNNKLLAARYQTNNILSIYEPKSWYLLNIDNSEPIANPETIANTTGHYTLGVPLATDKYFRCITFYNNTYYIGTDEGVFTTEDLENFTKIPETNAHSPNIKGYKNYLSFSQLGSKIIISFNGGKTFEVINLGSVSHCYAQLFTTENNLDYLYVGTQSGYIVKIDLQTKKIVYAKEVGKSFIDDLKVWGNKIIFSGSNIVGTLTKDGIWISTPLNEILNISYKRAPFIAIRNGKIYFSVTYQCILETADMVNFNIINFSDSYLKNNNFFLYNKTKDEFFINFGNRAEFLRTPSPNFNKLVMADTIKTFRLLQGGQVVDVLWEEIYGRYIILTQYGIFINYKV